MKGIDLSHYQEGLDLSNLKRGGYSFAILKLSEGRGIADASFDKFYDMAQAHNIPVGAYVFSHATNASVAQAEAVYAISLLKGRPLQLGVFMDIETTGQMQIPKEQLKQTVTAFKDTINRAGYDFGIYGSEYNAWSFSFSAVLTAKSRNSIQKSLTLPVLPFTSIRSARWASLCISLDAIRK